MRGPLAFFRHWFVDIGLVSRLACRAFRRSGVVCDLMIIGPCLDLWILGSRDFRYAKLTTPHTFNTPRTHYHDG